MIINFSNLPKPGKEKPTLILETMSGTAIQSLGSAFDIEADLLFNEVSTISFKVPAMVNGVANPHYNDITGMRVVEIRNCAKFILVDPVENMEGDRVVKTCKGYSMEYELSKKDFFIEAGTYCLYRSTPDTSNVMPHTIVDRMKEVAYGWTFHVDKSLEGKYRTFDETNKKLYDFMKTDVQQAFGCILDFDTINKNVYIKDAYEDRPDPKQVFLSRRKLIKDVEVKEESDSIVTCLDVRGAEGVSIRSVNPTGKNVIYNIDHFLKAPNFTQEQIKKWNDWESSCEGNVEVYHNLVIEHSLYEMKILTKKAEKTDLEAQLSVLENERAVTIQAISKGLQDKSQIDLNNVNGRISVKQGEIDAVEGEISSLKTAQDGLMDRIKGINDELDLGTKLGTDFGVFQNYFLEDSLQDSSFVSSNVELYNNEDDFKSAIKNVSFDITGSKATTAASSDNTKRIVSMVGGMMNVKNASGNTALSVPIIRATAEYNLDGAAGGTSVILTAFFDSGKLNPDSTDKTEFTSGTLTMVSDSGTIPTINHEPGKQFDLDATIGIATGNVYVTRNTSLYEQRQIEFDLLEYGKKVLEEKSQPGYSCEVSCANFLSVDEYLKFQNQFELGERVYLKLDRVTDDTSSPLKPFVIGVHLNYEDPSNFKIDFNSTYTATDKSFSLVKLLDHSVSMGQKLGEHSGAYGAFVRSGAKTSIKTMMDSALDLAKNAVMSSGDQAISMDETGLRIRKYMRDANNAVTKDQYDDRQIWAVENMIAFTDDGWRTSNMAIGEIFDESLQYKTGRERYLPVKSWETYDSGKIYYLRSGEDGNYEYNQITGNVEETFIANLSNGSLFRQDDGIRYGVCAPHIVGTLLAGSNLHIGTENGSFRVDESGVYIDSLKFHITHSSSSGGVDPTLDKVLTDMDNKTNHVSKELKDSVDTLQGVIDNGSSVTHYQDDYPNDAGEGDLWYVPSKQKTFRHNSSGKIIKNTSNKYDSERLYLTQSELEEAVYTKSDVTAETWDSKKSTLYIKNSTGDDCVLVNADAAFDYGELYYTKGTREVITYTIYNHVDEKTWGEDWNSLYVEDINNPKWQEVENKTANDAIGFISGVTDENNNIFASRIRGVLNSSGMGTSSGNVLFDEQGIWLMDTSEKETAKKVVWMNENGISFCTPEYKNGERTWVAKTSIGPESVATEGGIIAGKIEGWNIRGGTLGIGPTNDTSKPYHFNVDSSGNLMVGHSTESGNHNGYNFYVDSATGNVYANNCDFRGTLYTSNLSGVLTGDNSSWLTGCGIGVGATYAKDNRGYLLSYDNEGAWNFFVDANGQVKASGDITASTLSGAEIGIKNGSYIAGKMKVTGASSSDYAIDLSSDGALRLTAANGDVWIGNNYSGTIQKPTLATGGGAIHLKNKTFQLNGLAFAIDTNISYGTNKVTPQYGEIRFFPA